MIEKLRAWNSLVPEKQGLSGCPWLEKGTYQVGGQGRRGDIDNTVRDILGSLKGMEVSVA